MDESCWAFERFNLRDGFAARNRHRMPARAARMAPAHAGGGVLLSRLYRLASEPGGGFIAAGGPAEALALDTGGGALNEAGAEVVEEATGRLRAHAVGAPVASGFTAFLDGIQRAAVALYHGPVPVVHAYAAAVIRSRRARRMTTWARDEREAVFFPFPLLDPAAVAAAGIPPERFRDTAEGVTDALPLFPPALYARAATAIDRWRESLETGLAERWCERAAEGEYLLVDGSLTLSPRLAAAPHAVGLIKSHRTRFFDGEDARVLLGLRPGERTSVFRPGTRGFTPVHSWYLRLRAPEGHGIFWGLVRVEVAESAVSGAHADEISRWLLTETTPLALPDARWDRLLYPIRDCEEYLRARAPARTR